MTDKYRWYAVGLAIVVGAGLCVYGAIDGNGWIALVGSLFGSGGVVIAKPTMPR